MSQSNDELVREAVAAIGPWRAFLHAKRAEVRAQVAQMQAAHGAVASAHERDGVTPTPATAEAAAVPAAGHPAEASGGMTPEPEGPAAIHPATGTEARAGGVPSVPAPELHAAFEAALSDADRAALPLEVVDAMEERERHPGRFARAMVAAQRRGTLPDRLGRAVETLGPAAPHFREAEVLYDSGHYPELFEPYDPYDAAGGTAVRDTSPAAERVTPPPDGDDPAQPRDPTGGPVNGPGEGDTPW